jgi:hypothetical protein
VFIAKYMTNGAISIKGIVLSFMTPPLIQIQHGMCRARDWNNEADRIMVASFFSLCYNKSSNVKLYYV